MTLSNEQAALLCNGVIDIHGEIEESITAYIRDCLPLLAINDYPPIEVWITSDGGDIHEGLNIYDMLHTYPASVTGVVINNASSMAVVILQACDRRLAHPNAKLLIHDPIFTNISVSALSNGRRLRKTLGELDRRLFSRVYEILSKRCKRPIEEIRKKCHKEESMFANEALEFGLIDELVK